MLIHANDAALKAYNEDDASTATAGEFRRASLLVSKATRLSGYATDADGKATHPFVLSTLSDATCAQVAYWQETGDTGRGSAKKNLKAASIGGASYTYGDAGEGTGGDRLCGEANDILRLAGLLRRVVYVSG